MELNVSVGRVSPVREQLEISILLGHGFFSYVSHPSDPTVPPSEGTRMKQTHVSPPILLSPRPQRFASRIDATLRRYSLGCPKDQTMDPAKWTPSLNQRDELDRAMKTAGVLRSGPP